MSKVHFAKHSQVSNCVGHFSSYRAKVVLIQPETSSGFKNIKLFSIYTSTKYQSGRYRTKDKKKNTSMNITTANLKFIKVHKCPQNDKG